MTRYNAHDRTSIILSSIFCPLALLSVVLRFVARSKTKARVGLDDWLAVLTLLTYFLFCGIVLWGAENGGGGYDLLKLPLPTLKVSLKSAYIAAIISATVISVAKFSVLLLYRRIFQSDKRFRIAVNTIGALCIAWWLAASLGAALRCFPIESQWNPFVLGNCYNIQNFFIAVEIPNCILDWAIVALPIGVIRGLHLQLRHKVTLCFIFVLGGFVGIVSMIRMARVYKSTGVEFLTESAIWLQAQLCVAIICISLPTYRPLLPKGASFASRLRGFYHSLLEKRSRSFPWQSKPSESDESSSDRSGRRRFNRYGNLRDDGVDKTILTSAVVESDHRGSGARNDYPMNGIAVKNDVEVV